MQSAAPAQRILLSEKYLLQYHYRHNATYCQNRQRERKVSGRILSGYICINTPIYIKNAKLKNLLLEEPDIAATFQKARELSIVITGIGGRSSLPLINPIFRPYLTDKDLAAADTCVGSIYGYIIDKDGKIADTDLNQKLSAIPMEDILKTPHRIAVVYGRHKADITAKVIRNQFINELITDTETALTLLEHK